MRVIVVGAGIGGLTAALALHKAGLEVEIFEQARTLEELGVGFNLLPHATKALAALNVLPAIADAGVLIRELVYANRYGQVVWRELRGIEAGYETPQIAIHRGRLHSILVGAVIDRVGMARLHIGCALAGFSSSPDYVRARFSDRSGRLGVDISGDALIGCDGIHSTVRKIMYPAEGPPRWSGITLWRGATELPRWEDGHTMLVAGGTAAKFVFYPIHGDRAETGRRVTNWGIMAQVGAPGDPPVRREDWSRIGRHEEALQFAKGQFSLESIDPAQVIEATETVYEYPNCDRDPLPRWSFDRATLLGDAAHPMYPVGSNGASQAILDAAALARHLSSGQSVDAALRAYENERRPLTSAIVLRNREGGPEQVIDAVESRAPQGFDDLESVLSHADREAIVKGYAKLAGYAVEQVNRR